MNLIDSHAHLADLKDPESALENARKHNLKAVIAVSADKKNSKKTIELARNHPSLVYPALGLHPTEIDRTSLEDVIPYIQGHRTEIVAIGQIGLDYKRIKNIKEVETQKEAYIKQLELAHELDLPALIHSRDAHEDAYNLAERHGPDNIIFHWYDGPLNILDRIIDNGYYISATPALEISEKHRQAIKKAPLERILLETDSPVYMRNYKRAAEPADLLITTKALARLKKIDVEEVAETTTLTCKKIFNI
jgi:TatD DNase family protein